MIPRPLKPLSQLCFTKCAACVFVCVCVISFSARHKHLQGVAQEILDMAVDSMEVNTKKTRALCFDELVDCAKTGKLRPSGRLHGILRAIALLLKDNTQPIEELNSLIKIASDRSPKISLDLLWARVLLKKLICPLRSYKLTWKSVKPWASALHTALMVGMPYYKDVMLEEGRHKVAPPEHKDNLKVSATASSICFMLCFVCLHLFEIWGSVVYTSITSVRIFRIF